MIFRWFLEPTSVFVLSHLVLLLFDNQIAVDVFLHQLGLLQRWLSAVLFHLLLDFV